MIELTKANPDPETLKLVVWIASGIILLMLGIIGYLLKSKEESNKREKNNLEVKINRVGELQATQIDKLSVVIDTVSETVNNLKVLVAVIKDQQDERDPRIERRLNAHANRLDEHDKKITKIETTCNINHK